MYNRHYFKHTLQNTTDNVKLDRLIKSVLITSLSFLNNLLTITLLQIMMFTNPARQICSYGFIVDLMRVCQSIYNV